MLQKQVGRALAVTVMLFAGRAEGGAQTFEKQLEVLAADIAEGLKGGRTERVAVADFEDLQGRITELGRFIADEIETSLVMSKPSFGIVDRIALQRILHKQGLQSSALTDPATVKRVAEAAGFDGIVSGTVTPLGDVVRVSVKVIATETATVVAAARAELPRTQAIAELLEREAHPASGPAEATRGETPAADRYVFENDIVIVTLESFTRDRQGVLRARLRVENLLDEDIYLRWDPIRLVDNTGKEWPSGRVQGITASRYHKPTLFAPSVDGLVSMEFQSSYLPYPYGNTSGANDANMFDLTGQIQARVRGRVVEFPIIFSGIPWPR